MLWIIKILPWRPQRNVWFQRGSQSVNKQLQRHFSALPIYQIYNFNFLLTLPFTRIYPKRQKSAKSKSTQDYLRKLQDLAEACKIRVNIWSRNSQRVFHSLSCGVRWSICTNYAVEGTRSSTSVSRSFERAFFCSPWISNFSLHNSFNVIEACVILFPPFIQRDYSFLSFLLFFFFFIPLRLCVGSKGISARRKTRSRLV